MDIREEILRKRRAGKLPGDTTSLLKSWWQSHATVHTNRIRRHFMCECTHMATHCRMAFPLNEHHLRREMLLTKTQVDMRWDLPLMCGWSDYCSWEGCSEVFSTHSLLLSWSDAQLWSWSGSGGARDSWSMEHLFVHVDG